MFNSKLRQFAKQWNLFSSSFLYGHVGQTYVTVVNGNLAVPWWFNFDPHPYDAGVFFSSLLSQHDAQRQHTSPWTLSSLSCKSSLLRSWFFTPSAFHLLQRAVFIGEVFALCRQYVATFRANTFVSVPDRLLTEYSWAFRRHNPLPSAWILILRKDWLKARPNHFFL